jgi:hypothetical protein
MLATGFPWLPPLASACMVQVREGPTFPTTFASRCLASPWHSPLLMPTPSLTRNYGSRYINALGGMPDDSRFSGGPLLRRILFSRLSRRYWCAVADEVMIVFSNVPLLPVRYQKPSVSCRPLQGGSPCHHQLKREATWGWRFGVGSISIQTRLAKEAAAISDSACPESRSRRGRVSVDRRPAPIG